MSPYSLLLFFLLLRPVTDSLGQPTPVAELIASERAFARMAATTTTKRAFREWLAERSVVFRPGPVNGQKAVAGDPDSTPVRLEWYPAWVGMAAEGDMGFSTGPWRLRRRSDSVQVADGVFFSIWQRQAGGQLKVVADHGWLRNAKPQWQPDAAPVEEAVSVPNSRGTLAELMQADSLLNAAVRTKGRNAYGNDLHVPQAVAGSWHADSADLRGIATFRCQGGGVSAGGDLGYTYGEQEYAEGQRPGIAVMKGKPAKKVQYMRVWLREGQQWVLRYDVSVPEAAE